MSLQDSGIFIASSLIADSPEKENAEPGDTPAAKHRSGDGGGSRWGVIEWAKRGELFWSLGAVLSYCIYQTAVV